MGKNGDPLTGWTKEIVLEQRGCSFKVDKFNNNWVCLNKCPHSDYQGSASQK